MGKQDDDTTGNFVAVGGAAVFAGIVFLGIAAYLAVPAIAFGLFCFWVAFKKP